MFAVNRGNIENRIDPHFYFPSFRKVVDNIKAKSYERLENFVSFSNETTDFSEFENGEFDYLEIAGVALTENNYTTTKTAVVNAPSRAKMKTKIGDICISTTRPNRGAIVEIKENGIIASTGFSIIREVKRCISKKWLLYTLLSSPILTQMLQRSSGGNYPAIIQDELKKLYIPVCAKEKQEKMIALLDNALQEKANRLKQAEVLLSGMSDYILSSLDIEIKDYQSQLCGTVKLGDIKADKTFSVEYYHPERMTAIYSLKSKTNIETKKLSEIVEFCRNTVNSSDCTEKYLGLAGVESQSGELSGVDELAAGQAFVYRKGNVLYGRLRPYLNKVLLSENDGICSTEFHVMRILDEREILPEYLATIMRSDLILSQTKHMMTGNTHPRISNDDVKNLYIPIPSIEKQKEIVFELKARRTKARELKQTAESEWQSAKEQFEKELLQ